MGGNSIITLSEFHKKYGRLPTENDPDYEKELSVSDALSRFQVVRMPLMAPGCCSCCGSSDPARTYLDFGMTLEFHGVVYFCHLCLTEAYNKLKESNGTDSSVSRNGPDDDGSSRG